MKRVCEAGCQLLRLDTRITTAAVFAGKTSVEIPLWNKESALGVTTWADTVNKKLVVEIPNTEVDPKKKSEPPVDVPQLG